MTRFLKFIWGNPGRVRIVLSLGAGCALGIIVSGSSLWWLLLLLILLLRTHIPSVIAGWLPGFAVSLALTPLCEYAGRWILVRHELFWQILLSRPGVCCLDINQAIVIGSAAVALLFSVLLMSIATVLLPAIYRTYLKTRGVAS